MSAVNRKKENFTGQRMIVLPRKIINQLNNNNITKYLYATDIGYFPHAKGHFRQRPQGNMQFILIYCTKGKGWISVNGKRSEITSNQFYFIPKNISHTYAASPEDPWTIYWVHFSGYHADRFLADSINKVSDSSLTGHQKEERIQLFNQIFYNLTLEYSEKNLEYACMMLPHFLASFSHEQHFSKMNDLAIEDISSRAINYMKNNLSRKVSLLEIAQHCNLSVSHFSLLFKGTTKQTPIEYLNNLRIQQACHSLDFTTMNISEIAEKHGFSDPFYFSKVFKKSIGQSPRAYRRHKSG